MFNLKIHGQENPTQAVEIRGKITDALNKGPLPGVNIIEKGTLNGTISDQDGNYTLSVSSNQSVLVFSYIGYLPEEVQVGSQSEINVQLEEDIQSLEDVVVIGYGTQKKSSVTGSISSINSESFEHATAPQTDRLLQGKASGLKVSRNSGAPGQGARVVIRGLTGITESNPLYVVDGTPMEGIAHLNPSDIESVEVLKDASSAAIYGSRGADGVILITTKQGKIGETQITLDVSSGVSRVQKVIDKVNSHEFMMSENLGFFMDNGFYTWDVSTLYFTQEEMQEYSRTYDWLDAITQQGSTQDYNLSIRGGQENFSFFISGNYYDEKGVVLESGYKRYSARINTQYKATNWLTVGENFVYSNSTQDVIGSDIIRYARLQSPFIPFRDEETGERVGDWYSQLFNPLTMIEYSDNTVKRKRIQGNIFARITPVKGLNLESKISIDDNSRLTTNWNEQVTIANIGEVFVNDRLRQVENNPFLWNWQNTANYEGTISKVHNINLLVGMESQEENTIFSRVSGTDFLITDPSMRFINGALVIDPSEGGENTWSLLSYFGRFTYNYDERFYLLTSFRRDGSSRFGVNTRWGNFSSVSGAWRINQEQFMDQFDFLSNLKLRVGWGVTGDQSLSDTYPSISTLLRNTAGKPVYPLGEGIGGALNPMDYYILEYGADAFYSASPSNPNLGWEEVRTTNFGLDLGVLNNRVTMSVDYYQRTTLDMLVQPSIPFFTGFGEAGYANLGEFKNTGLDIDLGYKNRIGDLYYSISANANIPFINNLLVDLGGQDEYSTETRKVIEGETFGSFYGYVTDGIFQNEQEIASAAFQRTTTQPGDYRFKDLNADGIIDANDRTFLGTPYADLIGGLNMTVNYKFATLSVSAAYSLGNEIYSKVPIIMNKNGLDRWTIENRDAKLSRFTQNNASNDNNRISDQFIHDGSYFRLGNVSLSFNLPESLMNSTGILKNSQIYFTGTDLLTLTNYKGVDPEVGGSGLTYGEDNDVYPFARTITAGLRLNF